MKLHLGCGTRYLEGYVNIDFPPSEHTVQSNIRVDEYADITKLLYPAESADEVRSHHVFEHFSRPVALGLLCRWRDWLKPGGLLRIETPDTKASFRLMNSPFVSFDRKQQVMRHVFGSHEANWAVHWDGWYKDKFIVILEELGFLKLCFKRNKWGALRNIEVFATKTEQDLGYDDYKRVCRKILTMSTVRVKTADKRKPEGTELELLEVWIDMWDKAYKA
jgi:predicted SAM-dependent methyltransferase